MQLEKILENFAIRTLKANRQLNCQTRTRLFPLKVTKILICSLKSSYPELITAQKETVCYKKCFFIDILSKAVKIYYFQNTACLANSKRITYIIKDQNYPRTNGNSVIQVTYLTPFRTLPLYTFLHNVPRLFLWYFFSLVWYLRGMAVVEG